MELYQRICMPAGVFDRCSRSIAESEARGLAQSDELDCARYVAPLELRHSHAFERYDPQTDRWKCRCGMSMDRFAGLWNADGTRQQLTVTCTTEADPGVRSGRERLSC